MFETFPILFIVSSLIIIITPGQDMILVMSRSISRGSSAGVLTAAGISTGLMGHTLLASIGLGALLSSSLLLFNCIKIAGATYLIFLGVKMIKHSSLQIGLGDNKRTSTKRMFFQGMVSNITNPKITLFYFAFLPQFLAEQSGNHSTHLFMLGTFFALLTFMIKAPIGYCAGIFSVWLRSNPKIIARINRVNGTIIICLGLRLAFATRD